MHLRLKMQFDVAFITYTYMHVYRERLLKKEHKSLGTMTEGVMQKYFFHWRLKGNGVNV